MSDPAAPPPTDTPSTESHCKSCGYNLHALDPSGNCPECGDPIAYSLTGFYLENNPLEWLARVRRGLSLLLLCILLSVVGGLATALLMVVPAMRSGAFMTEGMDMGRSMRVATLVFLPINILQILAILYFTTPSPDDPPYARGATTRQWLRLWVVFIVVTTCFNLFVVATLDVLPANLLITLLVLIQPASTAVAIALIALFFHYLAHLMARARNDGLRKFGRIVFWGTLLAGIPVALGQVSTAVTNSQQMQVADDGAIRMVPQTYGPTGGASPTPTTTTVPVPPSATGPRLSFGLIGVQVLGGCGSCIWMGFCVAGLILLFLARSELNRCIQAARARSALPATAE